MQICLRDPLKSFHRTWEGVPAPALNLSPNAHFTLVSAYMNPWFTTTDEKGSRLRYAGLGQWCAIGRLNLVLGARVSA